MTAIYKLSPQDLMRADLADDPMLAAFRQSYTRALSFGGGAAHERVDAYADAAYKASAARMADGLKHRTDAADFTNSIARELTLVRKKVIEEVRPKLSAMELFPVAQDIAPGVVEHTQWLGTTRGVAQRYRAGMQIPNVNVGMREVKFDVAIYVIGMSMDIFEAQASAFASLNTYQRKAAGMRRAIEERINDVAWNGDDGKIYGVLNYPGCPRSVSSVSFVSATSGDDLYTELHRLANAIPGASREAFLHDTMIVSPRVHQLISTKIKNTNSNETVKDTFLRTSPYIRQIKSAQELTGAGPSGKDGIFFCKSGDEDSIKLTMGQGFTMVPQVSDGFVVREFAYAVCGGVVESYGGNNHLAWVTAQ